MDFLFVFSEKRSLSKSIHMYLNEFHLTSAEISFNKCGNQRGAGARLSPERSKPTPKHRRSGAGQLGGPGTGDARGPGTLLLRARRSHRCQPRSRGACRVRSPVCGAIKGGGARCPQPAPAVGASLGPSAPPRKRSRARSSELESTGERGGGGNGWRAPTRKVRELLCVRGLFINQPDTEQTWPLFAECLLFHQLLRPCSSFC